MNKFLIVIPSVFTEITTDYIHQTALQLSKQHCVLVLDLTKKQEESLLKRIVKGTATKPLVEKVKKNYYRSFSLSCLPLVRFKFVRTINKYLDFFIIYLYLLQQKKVSIFSKKVLWIFHPWRYKQISHLLKFFPINLLDIVDWFRIGRNERTFLSKASYVFVNSYTLEKKVKKYRPDCKLVPQGFDLDTFKNPIKKMQLFDNQHPVIGYVGGLSKRLDYNLLQELIGNNPQWNFVLWGPIFDLQKKQRKILDKILRLKNVVHGSSEKKLIPSIVASFDIGMIPYNTAMSFNKNCFPMKVFEYFYLNKLVISTSIHELERFAFFIKFGKNYKDWQNIIQELLILEHKIKDLNNQKQLAINNSWEDKCTAILWYLV